MEEGRKKYQVSINIGTEKQVGIYLLSFLHLLPLLLSSILLDGLLFV